MSAPVGPILVLDSASLYYRAFYALPEKMTAPDGRPHNAIRGFLSTVTRLVQTHRPSGLVACWDNDWRPQWRVDLVPSYKTHRVAQAASTETDGAVDGGSAEAEPESLTPQAEAIAEILDALGVQRWGVDGYEADDVAGSVVRQATVPCLVVTGDRDLVQLVDTRTAVQLTVNGGMEKWPVLDPAAAEARFGVPPEAYVDLAVLRGDPSDGLPGVPGIGAKTASTLVTAYGSVDGILAAAQAEPVTRPMTPRLAAALLEHAEAAQRALVVARVVTDLPIPPVAPGLPIEPADPARLADLAGSWGVARQVEDFRAALAAQTADE